MSFSESIEDLKMLIKTLINDVQEVKDEIKEVRNDINILKLEVREFKENNRNKDKKIDKKLIEKEMSRIGKKHVELEKLVIETGSMDDEFRKNILPKILEEEEKSRKEITGKLKIEEVQENKDE